MKKIIKLTGANRDEYVREFIRDGVAVTEDRSKAMPYPERKAIEMMAKGHRSRFQYELISL